MFSGIRWLVFSLAVTAFNVGLPASFCHADDAASDSRLEIIQFKAPADWKVAEKPGASKVYTAPDSTPDRQAVILVLLSPAQPNLNFRSTFDAIAKQMTASGKVVDPGEAAATKSRQGYDAISQSMVTEAPNSDRLYVRLVAVNVQNRMATFCYLAGGGALYLKHTPDMDALLQSVHFELSAPNPEKPNMAAAAKDVPASSEDVMLAKAKDEFAAGKLGRRKPHTVLGTVQTLDGRPIPNIVSCTIQINGTTIAAERTGYSTEPDKNGQYELQVPDGLYRVFVTCVVSVQGRNVPLDIMPIDGRATRVDESSAPGIVQDFRLVMAALKPGQDPNRLENFYGGVVAVTDPTYTPSNGSIVNRHPGAKLRLSFKPEGLVVDGTKVQPFSVDLDLGRIAGSDRIYRVPIGVYHVTGLLVAADGSTQPVTLSHNISQDFGTTIDVYWETVPQYANSQRTEARVYVRD